jgi:hypothetical protein
VPNINITKKLPQLFCIWMCLFTSSFAFSWEENVGSGTINGKEFPIAVVRNAGNVKDFQAALQKRFGERAKITVMQIAHGYQFLVQLFDPNALITMPFSKESDALEQYVISNSMSFTLFEIAGEFLAVGSTIAPFVEAEPGKITNNLFPGLKDKVKNATEITFKFANVEIYSLAGQVSADLYDFKLAAKDMLVASGLQPTGESSESSIDSKNDYEFYMDGKNSAANVAFSTNPKTKEVTVNVNQIKVR